MIIAMLSVLLWCPVLAAVQTLTIDSQLGTSVEDCFERISIGEQIPADAIYRNISELTAQECEQLCKHDKQCQTFDYGVGAKGNATCNLSTLDEKDLRAQNLLRRHPDYDIYVRRFSCEQSPPTPLQPQFDEENPPLHRPVFRPDEEEPKNPLSDDFLADLRPFETRPDFRPPRPYNNHLDSDRPDDYENSKPDFDSPPSYGAHKPPEIPYRPLRPMPYPERPLRPNDPYLPGRPGLYPYRPEPFPDMPYGPVRPLRPDNYRPTRPNDPYGSGTHYRPEDPYNPDRPLRPAYGPETPGDLYRPQRPGYNKPYNQSHSKPDPYDELQFQGGYGRPPRPEPGLWRPDPIYPPSPSDDVPDLYGPKPVRPERPPYKPEGPEYHYIVRTNKKPATTTRPHNDYNKPSQDPYKPDRPDPYIPNKPDPIPDNGYGIQDYPNKPNQAYKPKPDPYDPEPGPIGPPHRPYRPNRPYDYNYPSRPHEKPTYSYNSQYASGYGQNQDNSIYLEIYDPPRPYRPMRPLNDKPNYPSQGYGQNYGYGQAHYDYGSHSSHHSYAPSQNSHLGYGLVESGLYGQNYNKPAEDERPDRPYGQGSYGGSHSGQNFDYSSSSSGDQKPQSYKPSYGNQGSYGQNDYTSNQHGNHGNQRPLYDDDRPAYGSPNSQKPPYSSSHDSASYGSSQKPPYGDSPEKPYGTHKPPYGGQDYNQDPNRPDGDSQNYGQDYKPGQKPNETYRPDVRPVYEYELEKPTSVPSYIVKPNGDVVTSRPVTVGDYGKPGYERPGYDRPEYGSKPSYGDRPSYGEKPGYGDKPDYGDKPSYGDKPAYGDRPSYENRPSYGGKPDHGQKPGYGDKPTYGNRPSYGGQPGYGEKPGYGNKPGYDRPDYGQSGYEGGLDGNSPAYGSGLDSNRPGYGGAGYRDPGKLGSYKGCRAHPTTWRHGASGCKETT